MHAAAGRGSGLTGVDDDRINLEDVLGELGDLVDGWITSLRLSRVQLEAPEDSPPLLLARCGTGMLVSMILQNGPSIAYDGQLTT